MSTAREDEKSYFDQLPNEVLQHIFKYLVDEDLWALSKMSERVFAIAKSMPPKLHGIYFREFTLNGQLGERRLAFDYTDVNYVDRTMKLHLSDTKTFFEALVFVADRHSPLTMRFKDCALDDNFFDTLMNYRKPTIDENRNEDNGRQILRECCTVWLTDCAMTGTSLDRLRTFASYYTLKEISFINDSPLIRNTITDGVFSFMLFDYSLMRSIKNYSTRWGGMSDGVLDLPFITDAIFPLITVNKPQKLDLSYCQTNISVAGFTSYLRSQKQLEESIGKTLPSPSLSFGIIRVNDKCDAENMTVMLKEIYGNVRRCVCVVDRPVGGRRYLVFRWPIKFQIDVDQVTAFTDDDTILRMHYGLKDDSKIFQAREAMNCKAYAEDSDCTEGGRGRGRRGEGESGELSCRK